MAKISTSFKSKNEEVLLQLPTELNKQLRKDLLKAGQLVAKRARQLVPQPGYPGDREELKPLRDTIGAEYKELSSAKVVIVGPKRPAGAHGHLVEFGAEHHSHGKPTGRRTKATPFIEPAAQDTQQEQKRLVELALREADRRAQSG